jgi:peptidoglycan/LPS O-acetylase OafA/YrhL
VTGGFSWAVFPLLFVNMTIALATALGIATVLYLLVEAPGQFWLRKVPISRGRVLPMTGSNAESGIPRNAALRT